MVLEVVLVVLFVGVLIDKSKNHGIALLGIIAPKQHIVSTRSAYPVSQNWNGVAEFAVQLREDAKVCARDIQTMAVYGASRMREYGNGLPKRDDMVKLSVMYSFCVLVEQGGKQAS